jgi:hypothetical protein
MSAPRLAKGLPVPAGTRSRAWFSRDRRHRYLLIRELAQPTAAERSAWRVLLFVLLNPSSASHLVDDRTIAKCWRLTRRWGGTEMRICNVYGLRATEPKALWNCADPIGAGRDAWLRKAVEGFGAGATARRPADLVVLGWGNHAQADALRAIGSILSPAARRVFALTRTASGNPKHPLYVAEATPLTPFRIDALLVPQPGREPGRVDPGRGDTDGRDRCRRGARR